MKRSVKFRRLTTRSALPGRPVSASRTEMIEVVLPQDANLLGNILGGRVMHLIDIAGAIAAHRHCHRQVVTASVDHLDFLNPVRVGELIVLEVAGEPRLHDFGRSGRGSLLGKLRHGRAEAHDHGFSDLRRHRRKRQPEPVPPVIPKTHEERRRYREAGERRKARLAARAKRRTNKRCASRVRERRAFSAVAQPRREPWWGAGCRLQALRRRLGQQSHSQPY